MGRFTTLKLIPNSQGGYAVQPAGIVTLEDRVISISPIDIDTAASARASPLAMAGLRSGEKTNGVVLVVTAVGVRIFKPAAAKGASKTWSEYFCDAACVTSTPDNATALIGLFGDGLARTFSIPGLKELASVKVDHILDVRRFGEAIVAPTGDVLGWTGPSEMNIVNPWGAGQDK